MSALTTPRGPLPARVYWFRRLVVLSVAFVMVLGISRLLGAGGDGGDGDTVAQVGSDASQSAEPTESAAPTSEAADEPSESDEASDGATEPGAEDSSREPRPTKEPPAEPEGDCEPGDVVVEPAVWRPATNSRVLVGLDVSTVESPACYWDVSPETLTMKITSGDDDIWSTRQCPDAVPVSQVVVRNDKTTKVVVPWSGRRSDDECSPATDWAYPGYYVVEAAALAGEPSSVQFQLKAPPAPEVTRSPSPSEEPSGAVEPDRVG
ncbi:hypothetical protein [Nocardioides sp. CFH 31398]|uniref:hypothetical protein n=1 Tax=Nocardioides sp. CFH 31398 TaxID=2919579 RepID=UPI001F0662A0|nr:hypothetical protein [Nocardioides sp. CFH 31398]MCH1866126.1 hypothetical protein [Nocardioides sp. CFH 31398]